MLAALATKYAWLPQRFVPNLVAAYEPSNITKIWQDSARTTPVMDYGQPVGAIDDLSGNGKHLLQATGVNRPTWAAQPSTFGSELISNGDFASDTVWSKGAGVTISGGMAVFTASSGDLSQTVAVTAGKLYRLIFTVSSRSAGSVQPKFTGGTAKVSYVISNNVTAFTVYIRAETSNTTLTFTGTSATLNVDDVSLKEVTGYTGIGGLYFNSGTEFLSVSQTLSAYPISIAVAAKVFTARGGGGILTAFASNSSYKSAQENGPVTYRAFDRNASQLADSAPNVPAGGTGVAVNIFQSGTMECYANGATNGSTANTNAFGSVTELRMGKIQDTNLYFDGWIYAALITSDAISAADRAKVEQYYAARIGITF